MKKPNLRAPDFLTDVYRDMRDRRLLIPALALIVTALAIPVLLKTDPPAPVPAPPPPDSAEAAATEAAVLTEQQTGFRDYRKRLEALKERDPFKSSFKAPGGSGGGGGGEATGDGAKAGSESGSAVTASDDVLAAVEDASSSTGPSSGSSGISDVAVDVSEPDTSGETGVEVDVEVDDDPPAEELVLSPRVDVKVGPIGHTDTIENVRRLDFLPHKSTPVASFLGLRDGGEAALFSISKDVADTSGQGSCAPRNEAGCQYLTLSVGDERMLKYEPNGKTYRLKLIAAYQVESTRPAD